MSATTDLTLDSGWGDRAETTVQLSAITAGALIAMAHGGPGGAEASRVTFNVKTQPTSQDPIAMSFESASTTANTVSVRFTVPQGGDMTGAVVEVYTQFKDAAGGGIAVPS